MITLATRLANNYGYAEQVESMLKTGTSGITQIGSKKLSQNNMAQADIAGAIQQEAVKAFADRKDSKQEFMNRLINAATNASQGAGNGNGGLSTPQQIADSIFP